MRAADAYRARRREEEDFSLVAELEHPLIAQLKLKLNARARRDGLARDGEGDRRFYITLKITRAPANTPYLHFNPPTEGRPHDFVCLRDVLNQHNRSASSTRPRSRAAAASSTRGPAKRKACLKSTRRPQHSGTIRNSPPTAPGRTIASCPGCV